MFVVLHEDAIAGVEAREQRHERKWNKTDFWFMSWIVYPFIAKIKNNKTHKLWQVVGL